MVLPQPCSHQVTDRYHFTSLSVVTAPDAMAASSSSVMSMARLNWVVSACVGCTLVFYVAGFPRHQHLRSFWPRMNLVCSGLGCATRSPAGGGSAVLHGQEVSS